MEDVREEDEVERAGGEAEPVGGREHGLDLVEAALLGRTRHVGKQRRIDVDGTDAADRADRLGEAEG